MRVQNLARPPAAGMDVTSATWDVENLPWNVTTVAYEEQNRSELPDELCLSTNRSLCVEGDSEAFVHPYSLVGRVVLLVTAVCMCVTAVTANVLVLVTIALTKRLRTVNAVFLINLSTSDLLVGSLVLPVVINSLISEDPSSSYQQVHVKFFCARVFASSDIKLFEHKYEAENLSDRLAVIFQE